MNKDVHVGDKFIIEIDHVYWNPHLGNRYFAKGFNSLVFDGNGIGKLKPYKEPPKSLPHTCEFCKHQKRGLEDYPCILCDKNPFEQRDMFAPRDNG